MRSCAVFFGVNRNKLLESSHHDAHVTVMLCYESSGVDTIIKNTTITGLQA